MIYDIATLRVKYRDYRNIPQKIALESKKGNLIRIKRGLYTDNPKIDKPVIGNVCYGPSYISFEYALSYYGLIPEYVSMLTCACFGKKNRKTYSFAGIALEYRRIPDEVFPFGIHLFSNEEGIHYKMASREKALCDELYSKYPVRSIGDLKTMLFEDLRIDEEEFMKLDFPYIATIAPLYHSNTLNTLVKFIKGIQPQPVVTSEKSGFDLSGYLKTCIERLVTEDETKTNDDPGFKAVTASQKKGGRRNARREPRRERSDYWGMRTRSL